MLQEIERAGNKGVWTRDIKTHTNIPQQIVTKTLRLLETRRLVKSVKSISSKNKKLYMLFDLGAWLRLFWATGCFRFLGNSVPGSRLTCVVHMDEQSRRRRLLAARGTMNRSLTTYLSTR